MSHGEADEYPHDFGEGVVDLTGGPRPPLMDAAADAGSGRRHDIPSS